MTPAELLFRKYEVYVRRLAAYAVRNPADQDDIASAVWLRVVRTIRDPRQLPIIPDLWLCTLVQWVAGELRRKRRPELKLDRHTLDEEGRPTTLGALVPDVPRPDPDVVLDSAERIAALRNVLDPETLSAAEDMAAGVGLAEAARQNGLTRDTLRWRLANLRLEIS